MGGVKRLSIQSGPARDGSLIRSSQGTYVPRSPDEKESGDESPHSKWPHADGTANLQRLLTLSR